MEEEEEEEGIVACLKSTHDEHFNKYTWWMMDEWVKK